MSEIMQTKNYDMFKKHLSNRAIDNANLKKIKSSIQANNMMAFRPILVDKNYAVIDGQHRLEACRELGIDVHYQVKKDSTHEDIVLLNCAQKRWQLIDYLNYYCNQGNTEYQRLRDFARDSGYKITELFSFVAGARSRFGHAFKTGEFKFFEEDQIQDIKNTVDNLEIVCDAVKRYVILDNSFVNSNKFRAVLFSMLQNPELSLEVFLKKLKMKADAIRRCADTRAYYTMLRDIYNYKNQNPLEN